MASRDGVDSSTGESAGGPPAGSTSNGSGSGRAEVTELQKDVAILEKAVYEVKRVIVGQDRLVERILVGLLARGHVLLEGVPGVAKTLAVETFAKVVGGSFSRVQFTPDLVPTDLVGTRIYRQGREEFDTELGPVVANFVLADEINRAPAKVQSALLEVMAERHVSIGGRTFPMPDPFLVMATQNPIENEGVYPLPEAQRDRFLFKIVVDYPSVEEEREIVYRMGTAVPTPKQILDPVELVRLQNVASSVFVHHALVDYVVRVIAATRTPENLGLDDVASWIAYGASPRATLGIISASRALALLRGRDYVVPQDVLEVIPDVLRHRLVLSYDALADEVTPEDVITRVLQTVGLPQVAPQATGGAPQQAPAQHDDRMRPQAQPHPQNQPYPQNQPHPQSQPQPFPQQFQNHGPQPQGQQPQGQQPQGQQPQGQQPQAGPVVGSGGSAQQPNRAGFSPDGPGPVPPAPSSNHPGGNGPTAGDKKQ